MKLGKTLFVLTLVGAVIALVQRITEDQQTAAQQDFWKPTDPLRPHSETDA